jgi:hypothetical protein
MQNSSKSGRPKITTNKNGKTIKHLNLPQEDGL